jgi:ParB family transcriptional regulator, chromosome partitioning protein
MRYIPIDYIIRSPFWPLNDRPQPTQTEIDHAREQGPILPVTVRLCRQGLEAHPTYELLDGEREWLIAQAAQIEQIPAHVHERMSDKEARAFVEMRYHQSRERNAIERALEYKQVYDALGGEGSRGALTKAARKLGIRKSTLKQELDLLTLDPQVQAWVAEGRLSHTKASRLKALPGDEQRRLARRILMEQWSSRRLEQHLRGQREEGRPLPDADLRHLSRVLSDRLGTQAQIERVGERGWELRVRFHSLEELEGVLERPIMDAKTLENELR